MHILNRTPSLYFSEIKSESSKHILLHVTFSNLQQTPATTTSTPQPQPHPSMSYQTRVKIRGKKERERERIEEYIQ